MRYDEITVQELCAHLNELAGNNEFGVEVAPKRISRGVWDFIVTDKVGGEWTTRGTLRGYLKVKQWILSGL